MQRVQKMHSNQIMHGVKKRNRCKECEENKQGTKFLKNPKKCKNTITKKTKTGKMKRKL